MTNVEISNLLLALTSAFPDGLRFLSVEQAEATRLAYRTFLLDLPYDVTNAAIIRGIASSWKRWPSIAEIRAMTTTLLAGRVPHAIEAWGLARKMIQPREERAWKEMDATLARCLDGLAVVVWRELWRGGSAVRQWYVVWGENEAADRARFVELYEQLASDCTEDRRVGELAPAPRCRDLLHSQSRPLGEIVAGLLPGGSDEARVSGDNSADRGVPADPGRAVGPDAPADAATRARDR